MDHYKAFGDDNGDSNITDLINLPLMESLLFQIAVCSRCHETLSITTGNRLGVSVQINILCNGCKFSVSGNNSSKIGKPNAMKAEMNVRLAYAFCSIGKSQIAAKTFFGVMNMPGPLAFKLYTSLLSSAAKNVCLETMTNAVTEFVK